CARLQVSLCRYRRQPSVCLYLCWVHRGDDWLAVPAACAAMDGVAWLAARRPRYLHRCCRARHHPLRCHLFRYVVHVTRESAAEDDGDEPPPRFSARRPVKVLTCPAGSSLRFRRRSLSLIVEQNEAHRV